MKTAMNLWQVSAYATEDLFDEGNAPDEVVEGVERWLAFNAYFSTREAAAKHNAYGEKHFPHLHWSLTGYYMDDPVLCEIQFDDLHQHIGG